MNPVYQEYMETLRLKLAVRQQSQRSSFLMQEGLFTKEYAPDDTAPGYPFEEWDPALGKLRHYRKEPIELTDQQWQELQQLYRQVHPPEAQEAKAPISKLLTGTAWGLYIGGFLLGCGCLFRNLTAAFLIWIAVFLWGTFFLGMAEIIRLLQAPKS